MKTSILLLVTFTCSSLFLQAQYFYKDIWNNQQMNKEFSILRNESIRTVVVKSLDEDGTPSEGFFCEKRIDKNFTKMEMVSRSHFSDQSLLLSFFNERGSVIKTIDSTATSLARTEYEYDRSGRMTWIKTFTKADDDSGSIGETRQFFYTAAGKPEKIVRKKANGEISTINFTLDEKGNVIDEEEITKGVRDKKFLYYYDDKNRLTDVVSYSYRAKRLLPNYMYEYNPIGQVTQLIATEQDGGNYYLWKYTYNDQRLRESESCYSKEKALLGTITYQYK